MARRWTSAAALLFTVMAVLSVACVHEPEAGYGGGQFISSGIGASDMGSTGDEAPDPSADPGQGGVRLDVGVPAEPTQTCQSVDVLFVIDNSGSMCDYQRQLAERFPEFVDAMYDGLPPGTDLHVGIVTTSFSSEGRHRESACVAYENPLVIESHFDTHPNGENGFQGRLYEYEGRRYFAANTSDTQSRAQLQWWFSHAATSVGCSGGAFEYPAAAAAAALSEHNAAANAGFLRDERSTLAVFVLSDEVGHSPGPTEQYLGQILEAKSACGGDRCVVTGGLLSGPCMDPELSGLWRFLDGFERPPVWGDVRDPDAYADVLSTALADVIVQTCEELDPAG